ncbi:hypothetical protein PHYPSEUDO_004719 [Phytophthora pseudosyringae]|uniref:Uncharacterized protein n=1 Tax=Phytophthora pseudosyringae TaxID=221518 RepID=A0A8T1VQQ6_9STRA|nr:hypothetical protein PHYPSEUDO_004719 [Phytophthora pseudosyringae]
MKKPTRSSPALASHESFDERLRDVFSFRAAIPVLNEYLLSIQIDEDDPGFLIDWDMSTLSAFVAVANNQNPARAPAWLQTVPPQITINSFADDLVHALEQVAGGALWKSVAGAKSSGPVLRNCG